MKRLKPLTTLLDNEADFKRPIPWEIGSLEHYLGTECVADILALQRKRQLHKVLVKLQVPIV